MDSNGSLTLLGVFFMGLGLNLTPCVYPMLSITVSLFGANQEINRGRAFLKAVIYVLGIATTYSSLGVVTAFTGGFFGAFLQSRWVLLGISALFAFLALSMFGFYSLQAPAWLLNKVTGKRAAGLFGIYLSGLLVGVFAAPCIGPPVLALLAFVATKGNPVFAFSVFFVMSLGLGLPYLILGIFSSLLSKLPRSGVWLVWVDRLFGSILISFSAFYLILALNPDFLKWPPPVALVAAGFYLGFIERSEKYSPAFVKFKKTFGTMAVLAGLLIPFLIPRQSVKWEMYLPEKVAMATQNKKLVILDFYADWCIPCHELDRYTYSDSSVIKALEGFEKFKVNLTRSDTEESEKIMDQFGILGVPTVIFLGPDGQEIKTARQAGFLPPKEFLKILPKSDKPS